MPFVKNIIDNFKIVDDHLELNEKYLKLNSWSFKKITGSRFSCILGLNQYTSPFKIWLIMTNLYKDLIDETLSRVGNIIEPKIRDYVIKSLNQQYKTYNPKEIKWDVFKDNKIFGGIPDGEPINNHGLLDYSDGRRMLEIKTTSIDSFVYKKDNEGCLTMQKDNNGLPIIKAVKGKLNSWFVNSKIYVPKDYKLQLGLYLYLRKQNKGLFAISFLKAIDYAKPELFDPFKSEIKFVNVDYDLNQFQEYIDFATKWYENHIMTGKSPTMSSDDKRWLQESLKLS